MLDARNVNATVIGLGESGLKAALLLEKEGAIVRATDSARTGAVIENSRLLQNKYIETETGGHTEGFLEDTNLFVVSPGVDDRALPVRYAKEMGIPIISELELGWHFCKGTIIAVTGTNGKSTVVTLLGRIFEEGGKKAVVCGNVGNSFCGEIEKITPDTQVVIEVSSFQLEYCFEFKPHISAILNITDDHYDRYPGMNEYFLAKKRIFANQLKGDYCILNYDDPRLKNMKADFRCQKLYYSSREEVMGIYCDEGRVIFTPLESPAKAPSFPRGKNILFDIDKMKLKGEHNIQNALAAALAAKLSGVKDACIKRAVNSFEGLDHRIEAVAVINGVRFVDDSKGTNVDATRQALKAVKPPVILIAGGKDKMGDYSLVKDEVRGLVKKLVLIGEAKKRIAESFNGMVDTEECASMEEAVRRAFSSAKPGDTVLLSPMCSSFDMFRDYKHRAEAFKEAVAGLKP